MEDSKQSFEHVLKVSVKHFRLVYSGGVWRYSQEFQKNIGAEIEIHQAR